MVSYARQKFKKKTTEPKTFEDWIISRFGKTLFNLFFKNYSEKLWGMPCSDIDADFASQRIKKFSLSSAIWSNFFRAEKNKHATLTDHFKYPRLGSGQLYSRMKNIIEQSGGRVVFNAPVEKVITKSGNAIGVELQNGQVLFADEIISSMPLPVMVNRLDNAPEHVKEACKRLKFRNTILVYMEIDSTSLFPDQWLYVHDKSVKHGRITNFRNWSPDMNDSASTTILCLEYWCFDHDELWNKETAHFQTLAEYELRKLNLISKNDHVLNCHVTKLHRCYPVYETGYRHNLEIIKKHLATINHLRVAGRYGSFKYNNQDHSLIMGMLAAVEIIESKNLNLWEFNTDSEYLED